MHIFDFFRDIFSVFGAFSRFLGVKFGFRKSCQCKRNDKYEVCLVVHCRCQFCIFVFLPWFIFNCSSCLWSLFSSFSRGFARVDGIGWSSLSVLISDRPNLNCAFWFFLPVSTKVDLGCGMSGCLINNIMCVDVVLFTLHFKKFC